MGRLIEVQHAQACPRGLTVRLGDVLAFAATGGRVRSGGEAVELLGAFVPAVIGGGGQILSPSGAPNTVLFRARGTGRSRIDVVTGDPWRASESATLEILVEP
jgi:hypothetical protein